MNERETVEAVGRWVGVLADDFRGSVLRLLDDVPLAGRLEAAELLRDTQAQVMVQAFPEGVELSIVLRVQQAERHFPAAAGLAASGALEAAVEVLTAERLRGALASVPPHAVVLPDGEGRLRVYGSLGGPLLGLFSLGAEGWKFTAPERVCGGDS